MSYFYNFKSWLDIIFKNVRGQWTGWAIQIILSIVYKMPTLESSQSSKVGW